MISARFPNLAASGGWVGEVTQMKENDFIVRWLAHKSSAVFYKSRQMAESAAKAHGRWLQPLRTTGRAGAQPGRSRVTSSSRGRATWGVAEAGITWWDSDPGGPRAAPRCAGLRLTGLMRLLNMETTSSPAVTELLPGPVRLTLNVRPGGVICRAAIIHHDYLTEQDSASSAASAAALHLFPVCLKPAVMSPNFHVSLCGPAIRLSF